MTADLEPSLRRLADHERIEALAITLREQAAARLHVAPALTAARPAIAAALATLTQRPLLYIGGGIHAAGAYAPLLELSRRADIPVVSSLHGLGAYPGEDPRFLGMRGMHGAPYTNHATEEADLVIAVGARFDDRATGLPESFCRNAEIIHLDVDARELGKIKPIAFGVVVDARVRVQEASPTRPLAARATPD